jgi:hypothetical protein
MLMEGPINNEERDWNVPKKVDYKKVMLDRLFYLKTYKGNNSKIIKNKVLLNELSEWRWNILERFGI